MKRKLIKFSNYSFCITLPKQAVDSFGWKKGQSLEVDFKRGSNLITITSGTKSRVKQGRGERVNRSTKISDSASSAKKSSGVKPIPELRW